MKKYVKNRFSCLKKCCLKKKSLNQNDLFREKVENFVRSQQLVAVKKCSALNGFNVSALFAVAASASLQRRVVAKWKILRKLYPHLKALHFSLQLLLTTTVKFKFPA